MIQCGAPQEFEVSDYRYMNSTGELENLVYGDVIVFECDWNQGFEPAANQSITFAYWKCNENGTWDKSPLACTQNALLKSVKLQKAVTFESDAAVPTAITVLSICAFFLGIVVCLDYMTVDRDLRRLRHNIRQMLKWLRDKSRVDQLHHIRSRVRNLAAKEKYLQSVQAAKEQAQLAAAGFAVDGTKTSALVSNPLDSRVPGDRPISGFNSQPRHRHVEGEMDIPSDISLQQGFASP